MTKFGTELLTSVREARAIARGDAEPGRVVAPPDIDVRAIRHALGMSQQAFAELYGFTAARVRDWEQGRSKPDNSIRRYLTVIHKRPAAVLEAFEEGAPIVAEPHRPRVGRPARARQA